MDVRNSSSFPDRKADTLENAAPLCILHMLLPDLPATRFAARHWGFMAGVDDGRGKSVVERVVRRRRRSGTDMLDRYGCVDEGFVG